jgi:beta-glucosidase
LGASVIRNHVSNSNIGSTFSVSHVTPFSDSPDDIEAADRVDHLLNRFFLNPILGQGYPLHKLKFLNGIEKYFAPGDDARLKTELDFIGIQNYTREVIRYSWFTPFIKASMVAARKRKVPFTEMGWEVYPEGIYEVLKSLSSIKGIPPLIVTENGAAFPDILLPDGSVNDQQRIRFLQDYIEQVMRARNEGIDVRGYFAWSITDNFEWAEGYRPRFGLVHIDYENGLKRTIKESGKWFGNRVSRQL